MGELWVNYAELADAIGEDGAEKLCRAVGGVSTYIPRTQPEGSPLCGVIGMERMRRLCSAFGGLRVTLPNRRRSEPSKVRIARLLESGKAPGAVALEIGVTERYVRMIASRCKIGSGGSGGRGSACRPDCEGEGPPRFVRRPLQSEPLPAGTACRVGRGDGSGLRKAPCAGCGRFPPQPRKRRKAACCPRRGEVPAPDTSGSSPPGRCPRRGEVPLSFFLPIHGVGRASRGPEPEAPRGLLSWRGPYV